MDLTGYDGIMLSTSGGKDSQVMLEVMHKMAEEQGVLDLCRVVHADLGKVEWEGTVQLAREQAEHYGFPFYVVKRELGDLLHHIEARGMFPDAANRYCTSDHKTSQCLKLLTAWDREAKAQKKAEGAKYPEERERVFLNVLGLRAEESPRRAKMPALELDKKMSTKPKKGGSRSRTVYRYLPIHDMKEDEVWSRIKASGVRHHWAYDEGMKRLSCAFCIFAPKPQLALAMRLNPGLYNSYVRVEKKIGHTFKNGWALGDLRSEVDSGLVQIGGGDGKWNM